MSRACFVLCVCVAAIAAGVRPCGAADDQKTSGGLMFTLANLPRTRPPADVMLCFQLVAIGNADQRAVLESVVSDACAPADTRLVVSDRLVIKIQTPDKNSAVWRSLAAIGVSITTQAGTAIDPAPVVPTTSRALPSQEEKPQPDAVFIAWPIRLGGDTIPTITITGLFADKTVTLLDFTLPQVHTLYYYNVTTGVVVTSLRNPSFIRVPQAPANGSTMAQYTTATDNGSYRAMPILLFTAYFHGFDAERAWHPGDLWPGVAFGFSLSSPADDFFFGLSSEVRRHVQVVGGLHLGKVTEQIAAYDDPTSSTAPTTTEHFHPGAFLGATLNIDFIKGLFGGK